MFRFLIVILFFECHFAASAQAPKDAAVPIQLATGVNPPAVLLNWPNPVASDVVLRRRVKGQAGNSWSTLLNVPFTNLNGYFDTDVLATETYEYALDRTTGPVTAHGYAYAALYTPLKDVMGKVLLFVDSIQAGQLGADLTIFENDLRGDGWQVVQYKTTPNSTVQSVKNQIVNAYNADTAAVKAVILLGNVPVPYSGSKAWDNQPTHVGAWPCDAYYGDVNGVWTDNSVNVTSSSRAANRNVPGDGKFDQNTIPSAVELAVGRIDFRHLSILTFGYSPVELMRRYLQKNHNWRTGQYRVSNQAVVDDYYGWSGGAAYAADGFRNAYPLVGPDHVVETDLLGAPHALMGYGASSGAAYTSDPLILSAANCATDSLNFVFAGLFGDYFGDWDYDTNPLLPAALASKGGLLACGWAGLPHWFLQGLAAGETIGFCLKETQNAQYNDAYGWTDGKGGAQVSLLGDPTVKARIVTPVTNLTVASNCNKINLHWTASPDSGILGYLVYRSFDLNGPFTRQTPNPIYDTFWADLTPLPGTVYYSVRAVKIETVPGGGTFYNASTGAVGSTQFVPGQAPTVIGLGGDLNCIKTQILLGANFQPPTCTVAWTAPDGTAVPNFYVSTPGIYTVVATAPNGCTAIAYATVNLDTMLPGLQLPQAVALNCIHPSEQYTFPAAGPGVEYTLNGNPEPVGTTISWTTTSVVNVASTVNGCAKTFTVPVTYDTLSPGAFATSDGNNLDCAHSSVHLYGAASASNVTYSWTGAGGLSTMQNIAVSAPGTYCLQVSALNGCTSSACIGVQAVGQPVYCQIDPVGAVCNNPAGVTLQAAVSGGTGPFQYHWSTGATDAQITLSPGFSGTVHVTITDHLQCTGNAQFTVSAPITIYAQKYKESAPGAHDGHIELLVVGGAQPFTYLWNTGATTQNIDSLGSGTYQVTVTGADGCTATTTIPLITVGTATPEAGSVLHISPNPADRLLTVGWSALGGGHWRILSAGGGLYAEGTVQTGIQTFQADVSGLPGGIYVIQVLDSRGRPYLGHFSVVR